MRRFRKRESSGDEPSRAAASIRSAARAVPSADRIAAPSPSALERRSGSPTRRSTARRSSSSSNAYVSRRTPRPSSCTRWALSYWSQNSGRTIIGLPKWNASVVVLLPPWVITRSQWGITLVWGTRASPHMLSGSSNSSARGPFDTTYRCGVSASTATSRRISSTSAEPSDPSDRYTSAPSPASSSGTSHASSVRRTDDSNRCQVGAGACDRR